MLNSLRYGRIEKLLD